MTEETNRPRRDDESEQPAQPEQPASQGIGFWKRLGSPKWLAILLGATILLHGVGIACTKVGRGSPSAKATAEVSLGKYQFVADPAERGRIAGATFSLHIAILPPLDGIARDRLEDRRFRVQQDVEELLRRAHGGDFDDPALGELKRQFQERINETLGMRAISDVIITDLDLRRPASEPQRPASTAEKAPWAEKPAG